jgi:hypothetical protein
VKELAAAIGVPPTLEMHTLGVLAHKQIAFKIRVVTVRTKAFEVSLTFGVKLGFLGPDAAIGALKG